MDANWREQRALVIVDSIDGVLFGECLGELFWSRGETADLVPADIRVSAFDDEAVARAFIAETSVGLHPRASELRFVEVDAINDGRKLTASMAACVRAGIDPWHADSRPFHFRLVDSWDDSQHDVVAGTIDGAVAELVASLSTVHHDRRIDRTSFSVLDCSPVTDAYLARHLKQAGERIAADAQEEAEEGASPSMAP